MALKQFPVLSGFETPWEIARWQGNAAHSIDDSIHLEGSSSMRVLLGTERYSGVGLEYFQKNWKGAKGFRFSVFNPSKHGLSLTCKIYDQQHEKRRRRRYTDRFNQQYEFPPGWTTVEIDARDIRNSPKGRQMDMEHIAGVGIFAMRLAHPQEIYVDDVCLIY